MGELTQTWSGELKNWRATASNDENAYEIDDDDFSTSKANGADSAKDKGQEEQKETVQTDYTDKIALAMAKDGRYMYKYISQKTGVRHNTEANYNFVINIIKKEAFGNKRIDKVKLSDAKGWLIKLQADGTLTGDDVVLPVTLEYNVQKLHEFLFPGEEYYPSATVQEYSNHITELTGYGSEDVEWASNIEDNAALDGISYEDYVAKMNEQSQEQQDQEQWDQ